MKLAKKKWDSSQIKQFEMEIEWLKNEMKTKKLSKKQEKEYNNQIKKKELEICFNVS